MSSTGFLDRLKVNIGVAGEGQGGWRGRDVRVEGGAYGHWMIGTEATGESVERMLEGTAGRWCMYRHTERGSR